MKKGIHPKYHQIKVKCSCGAEFETGSTSADDIQIEICSECHPFYTGKQKLVDTAGRLDKFQKRMAKFEEMKKTSKPKKGKKEVEETEEKVDKEEKPEEIKEKAKKESKPKAKKTTPETPKTETPASDQPELFSEKPESGESAPEAK